MYWSVNGSSIAYPDPYGRNGSISGTGTMIDIGIPAYMTSSNWTIYGMADVDVNGNSTRQDIITYAIFIK